MTRDQAQLFHDKAKENIEKRKIILGDRKKLLELFWATECKDRIPAFVGNIHLCGKKHCHYKCLPEKCFIITGK